MMSRYALELEGYDEYSVWGYDDLDHTYFAQIWRNDSGGDGDPQFSLNWWTRKSSISTATILANLIAVRTGRPVPAVMRAMASATRAPESADLLRLADELRPAQHGKPRPAEHD